MSGFLDRLAVRATASTAGTGIGETLRPRLRSRFEPGGGVLAGDPLDAPLEESVESRPASVETETQAPRRERPVVDSPEPTIERRDDARVREEPEPPASPPSSRRPERFSVAWPVLDQSEETEPSAPAPSVMPRLTLKTEPPASREEPAGRLEPRAKRPFSLGGGGLEQGERQDGGGLGEGNLDLREGLDGDRAPHPLAPSPIPSPRPGEGERRFEGGDLEERLVPSRAVAPLSRRQGGDGRGDGGEGLRADLPTLEPARAAEPLPELVDDEPSETVVRINIGQIDVRMPQPAAPAPRPAARAAGPRLTLADYLKARQERRR